MCTKRGKHSEKARQKRRFKENEAEKKEKEINRMEERSDREVLEFASHLPHV